MNSIIFVQIVFCVTGRIFFEDRAFRINHINKIKNQKLETITLSYDLNQQHILKFLRLFRDIVSNTKSISIICVSQKIFSLINKNSKNIPFARLIPFKIVLPNQLDQLVITKKDELFFS